MGETRNERTGSKGKEINTENKEERTFPEKDTNGSPNEAEKGEKGSSNAPENGVKGSPNASVKRAKGSSNVPDGTVGLKSGVSCHSEERSDEESRQSGATPNGILRSAQNDSSHTVRKNASPADKRTVGTVPGKENRGRKSSDISRRKPKQAGGREGFLDGLVAVWKGLDKRLRWVLALVVTALLVTGVVLLFAMPKSQGAANGGKAGGSEGSFLDSSVSGSEGAEGKKGGETESGMEGPKQDTSSGPEAEQTGDTVSGGENPPESVASAAEVVAPTPTPVPDIRKLVALTYDDGPSNSTPLILDALEKYGVKATFFVVGKDQVEYHREILQRAYQAGMEIGSHTYDHRILSKSTEDEIRETMRKNDELLQEVIGFQPKIMRPTGGGINDTVRATIDRPMILWNIDTLDWDTENKDAVVANIKENVHPGAIVLMHDLIETTGDATWQATEEIVPWLLNEGYEIVTISEMANAYGYTLNPGQIYYSFNPLWSPNPEIAEKYAKAFGE